MPSDKELVGWITAVVTFIAVIVGIVRGLRDEKKSEQKANEVRSAEAAAFQSAPTPDASRSAASTSGEEKRLAPDVTSREPQAVPSMASLMNVYSKQIERYQFETRRRASWSFIWAITAMFAGFAFVIWGGWHLLTAKDSSVALAAGGMIAGIGGAISGFLAKTFLDVHRMSLSQLNRYFRQPVINEHVLMAQRLAVECGDDDTRKRAYEQVITSLAGLITKAGDAPVEIAGRDAPASL